MPNFIGLKRIVPIKICLNLWKFIPKNDSSEEFDEEIDVRNACLEY